MIRKTPFSNDAPPPTPGLNLESIASFQVSSESPGHPLENALQPGDAFWLAAVAGAQTIRINFDAPQDISQITLVFEEQLTARMQEFALSWRRENESSWRELRRQQFNFSPPNMTEEREAFKLSLKSAIALEIKIDPAVNGVGKAALTYLGVA